jgi:hypothetical protein
MNVGKQIITMNKCRIQEENDFFKDGTCYYEHIFDYDDLKLSWIATDTGEGKRDKLRTSTIRST